MLEQLVRFAVLLCRSRRGVFAEIGVQHVSAGTVCRRHVYLQRASVVDGGSVQTGLQATPSCAVLGSSEKGKVIQFIIYNIMMLNFWVVGPPVNFCSSPRQRSRTMSVSAYPWPLLA